MVSLPSFRYFKANGAALTPAGVTAIEAATVEIPEVLGTNADFIAADKAMQEKLKDPSWKQPKGYTWNHAGKPGSKIMELVDEDLHARVAHKGNAATARAANRIALRGDTIKSVGVIQVYLNIRDAVLASGFTKDQYDVEYTFPYYFVSDDGSIFIVKEHVFPRSVFSSDYIEFIEGPRKGQTEKISDEKTEDYRRQAESVYGRYIPGGFFSDPQFIPGTLRKSIPIMDGTRETGYIDKDGVHKYQTPIDRGT